MTESTPLLPRLPRPETDSRPLRHAHTERQETSRAVVKWTPRPGLLTTRHARPARRRLEPSSDNDRTRPLAEQLRERLIGQDVSVERILDAFARLAARLEDPTRPLLTLLLLGPTGVGKTETARALAHALFGSPSALTRVDCEEYGHGHEVSKLFGSPPGYVGHDIEPLLSQERLDHHHLALRIASDSGSPLADPPQARPPAEGLADHIFGEDSEPVSIVLFDEIEKAHPSVWSALLGALDNGVLTLGDNRETSLRRSIVLLTSNVGSDAISGLLGGGALGFARESSRAANDGAIMNLALEAARRAFPPEFLNRMDLRLVYGPLEARDQARILDRFLSELQGRILARTGVPLLLEVSAEGRALLVERGTDRRYGARPLRRAVERSVVQPLSRLLLAQEVVAGDVVEIDVEDGELAFYRGSRQVSGVVA